MISCLTLTEDQNAAAAQQLVCAYLVRACRDAMYELALDEQNEPGVRHKAIQTLKVIHKDWVQAAESGGGADHRLEGRTFGRANARRLIDNSRLSRGPSGQ